MKGTMRSLLLVLALALVSLSSLASGTNDPVEAEADAFLDEENLPPKVYKERLSEMESFYGFTNDVDGKAQLTSISCPMFGKKSEMGRKLKLGSCKSRDRIGPREETSDFPLAVNKCYLPGLKGMLSMFPAVEGMKLDKDLSEALTPCCEKRSACHGICYMPAKICDKSFQTCAQNACNAIEDEMLKAVCHKDLKMFNIVSRMSECMLYGEAQAKACECYKDPELAKAARRRAINIFYAHYNPEKNPSTLLEKVESAESPVKKFAVLMNMISEKYYPESVRQSFDEKAEALDKIISEKFGFKDQQFDYKTGALHQRRSGSKEEFAEAMKEEETVEELELEEEDDDHDANDDVVSPAAAGDDNDAKEEL